MKLPFKLIGRITPVLKRPLKQTHEQSHAITFLHIVKKYREMLNKGMN